MNKRLLTLIAIFAFALTATGCAGINGTPDGLPSMEIGFTEVGNPDEDEAQLKGIYVNHEFDVAISYPVRFSVDAISSSEARFSSDDGEQLTYSFLWLEEGDTFDSFIVDIRGGFDGLEDVSGPHFDKALCKEDSDSLRGGMNTVECYYYMETEDRSFVVVKTGIVKDDTEFETTSRLPAGWNKTTDHSSDDDSDIPSAISFPEGLHSSQADDTDDIPTAIPYPEGLHVVEDDIPTAEGDPGSIQAVEDDIPTADGNAGDIQVVANEDSNPAAVKRHPLSSRVLSVIKGTQLTSD
jgi:hypothetical protein